MSRINNRLDKIIKLLESRVGFTLDDRAKLKEELNKVKEYLCCLPNCEDYCIEVVDTNGNIISLDIAQVCVDHQIDLSACLSIMQADFFATSTTEDILVNIQFNDLTNNSPTNWYWDFGDGNTSTLQNPIHQYAGYGLYTVTLIAAKDGAGDIETKTNYITIADPDAL